MILASLQSVHWFNHTLGAVAGAIGGAGAGELVNPESTTSADDAPKDGCRRHQSRNPATLTHLVQQWLVDDANVIFSTKKEHDRNTTAQRQRCSASMTGQKGLYVRKIF